ncbi:GyrI-like domain-containing protein [Oceanotoga sp. DSM 15011]|jgi:effector-binding domain-containing protein|uniref:Effector-binding domain-containing protein n=1 Tax=Oceanotoga teriensis TaxID=515440 RepID=A0AA45C7D5_9BACT|nr:MULTISPECIES: GyrI-like domain-containing protein [Oceanotoga]MDN5342190.1 hypothetical protein [Oceanotoga sp.]PWJ95380.1 effector-binding domain-containing protein [Oceanotoga teriensis]UYP01019.1 GyrI-like domain-containing protein [Oceanotoga sp. DSM 15011]
MNESITIENVEPLKVASINYEGILKGANKFFPKIFKSIKGQNNGAPFFNYYFFDKNNQMAKIELCVPTNEIPNNNSIESKTIKGGLFLCKTHKGSYSNLQKSYEELTIYAEEHNLKLSTPWREIFVKGPGLFLKGNEDNYITLIQIPILEE